MDQFFYNMAKTYSALKQVLFVFNYKVLTMHGERKTKVIRILKRPNQLKIRWTKTLNLVFKIINENAQPGL